MPILSGPREWYSVVLIWTVELTLFLDSSGPAAPSCPFSAARESEVWLDWVDLSGGDLFP